MNTNQKKAAHDALDAMLAKLPDDCDAFNVVIKTCEHNDLEQDSDPVMATFDQGFGVDILEEYVAEITVDNTGKVFIDRISHLHTEFSADAP